VPVAAVCVAVLNRRFRAEAGACPLTRPAALPPHPVGTSTTLRGGCCEHRFDSLSELACRGSRRGRAHISRCASSAPRQSLRPRLGYPTRLTPRRTVQALYRQSSLSGSRYRARWRHESRIFVILDKFSGIRSHCTLPPLYPPITDGPNIGVMSGRQCVAGHGHDPDGAEKAWRPRCGRRRGRPARSGVAPSMGVRPSRVGLRAGGGGLRGGAEQAVQGGSRGLPPDPTGGSAAASRRDLNDSAWRLL